MAPDGSTQPGAATQHEHFKCPGGATAGERRRGFGGEQGPGGGFTGFTRARFGVAFAGKYRRAVFVPHTVLAGLAAAEALDPYTSDGAKEVLSKLSPMVEDEVLVGWVLQSTPVGTAQVGESDKVDACAEASVAAWLKVEQGGGGESDGSSQ